MSGISNINNYSSTYGVNTHRYNKKEKAENSKEAVSGENKESNINENRITFTQRNNKTQVSNFSNLDEFTNHLMENYENFKNGTVTISKSYFKKCLDDKDECNKLKKTLSEIENVIKDSEDNINGYIGMRVEINTGGEVETETCSGTVIFNEGKRAAQIAASMTNTDINMIMNILNKDLSDCENGLKNGFCDENEVNKVKTMIKNAQSKQLEIAA